MDFFKNDVNAGGSLNRGDTCYLNNVKQELFKGFTEAVERHNSCMDRHLRDLFDELQRHTASTNTILNKLGIDRVYEQQDAAEFYVKILSQTSDDASQIFHGELTHTTVCCNPQCGAKKPTDSRFWHLPLSLTDSYSEEYQVVDGVSDFFRDSHFSGLDQMFCEECDDKVDATVRCEVKHHPQVLVLLLKRFDFDYRYMRYVKNNRAVIVPFTLNIPENQTYELYAVVDHVGDLRGGHYIAVIKSQDDERWYSFNDRSVSVHNYQWFQLDHTERSHSAYLLFYRKQTSVTLDGRQTSAPVKYHGLINQGATCYLNSLLQVLFMTREFRDAVNRFVRTVDHHLRGLFDDLHRHTVDTCDIITKLVTTVFEPQEAAQFVQRISAPSMHQASQSQTRCCKCQTGRSRESSVWHLPLTLMDSNSEEYCLVDGLKQCLTDQVSCERCGSRIDVITKCEVKPHPEVLVLLLKRFDFDHHNMTFVKNNRAVNITQTLQISENQTYELYAVVDHAVIASLNDGRWYNYYDNTHVSPFQHGDTERSPTVHLLFYRRQRTADTFSQDIREVFSCEGVLPATSDTNQSPHTETIRQRDEVREAVEEGDDAAETGSTGENKETQITVCVEPTEPDAHVCNVEDQDSGAGLRQRDPHSEDSDGNKTDEQEIMRNDDENMRRNRETDGLTDKTNTVTKDERAEDQDEKGVADINDFSDGHLKYIVQKQYDMSSDQRRVMDEQTVDDEQSENLHREHEISEGADDVGLKIRQRVDNRDFTEGKSTDNELNVLPCEGVTDKQSPHTETMRQKEEVKEAVEEGDDAAETGSTGENEETQITVYVEPTEPEAHVCNVEDQDSGAGVRQREAHSDEDSDGNKTDEQEIMRHDDENMRRNRETNKMTYKTDAVTKETKAENNPDTETIRQEKEEEEGVQEVDEPTETGSTGQNEETQITVCVEPVKPEAHVCNVEDQDSGAGLRQREPHSDEDSDGNKTDEQKIMRHDDENMRRNRETDELTDKTNTTEERADDQDGKGEDEINDLSDGHLKYIVQKQFNMSRDQRRVMDEQTVGDEQSENLHTEHQGEKGRNKSKRRHDREGLDADNPHSRKVKNSGVDSSDTEFGGNKEIKDNKKQKCEDDEGAGVKTQNTSNHNNMRQRETRHCSRHFVPREEKSDDGDGRSRRTSDRSSDGGEEAPRKQEIKLKHADVQNKDVKKRDNVHSKTREGDVRRSKDQSQQRIIHRTDSGIQRKKARTEEETSHGTNNRRERSEVKPDLETDTLTQAVHRSNLKEAPEPETSQKTRRDTGKREETESISPLNEEKTHDVQMEAAGIEQAGKQRKERRGGWWRKWTNSQKKEKKMRKNEQNKENYKEKSVGGREKNDSDNAGAQYVLYNVKRDELEIKGQSEKQRGNRKKCCFKTKKTRTERVEDTSHGSKKHRGTKQADEERRENRGAWPEVRNALKPRRKVAPQSSDEDSHGEGSLMGGRGVVENNDSGKTPCWRCICCICGTC